MLSLVAAAGVGTLVGTGSLAGTRTVATDAATADARIVGSWYFTTYLGDPTVSGTPKLHGMMALHADRTMVVTATDHTGQHPFFDGESTHGIGEWEPVDGGGIAMRFVEFNDGPNPPASFRITRVSGIQRFDGMGRTSGTGGFDYVGCPNGATGCPSPFSTPFPEPTAFFFTMERMD